MVVDDDKADYYRSLPGELGQRLRQVLAEEDGETVMTIENRRCPMWRNDGLCRIHAELGEDALCTTCREFPRLTHDYGNFIERQLELSCPVAAKLILEGDSDLVSETCPGGDTPDYDHQAMAILLRTRGTALKLINDPHIAVEKALASLLIYGYAVQNELDGGEAAPDTVDIPEISAHVGSEAALLAFFKGLEILTEDWRARLDAPLNCQWEDSFRAVASYFIMRYWLQAVADYDLVARVKLTIISCLVIKLLGGEVCQTAQQYSKEIENDAENIDAILDGAYEDPALTDACLLDMLRR